MISDPIIETRGGRRVVLKPLDDDCLLDGDLHPSIRLRLSRVRELPMTSVANLHGVERIDGRAYLIWDHVPGRTLDQIEPARRESLPDEVRLIVETLHSFGIVHGALHERNIIIDDHGGVHLTHVSPLLHNDPAEDLAAIERLFLSPLPVRRERSGEGSEQAAVNVKAVVGAAIALVIGVAIAASFLWYSSLHS